MNNQISHDATKMEEHPQQPPDLSAPKQRQVNAGEIDQEVLAQGTSDKVLQLASLLPCQKRETGDTDLWDTPPCIHTNCTCVTQWVDVDEPVWIETMWNSAKGWSS